MAKPKLKITPATMRQKLVLKRLLDTCLRELDAIRGRNAKRVLTYKYLDAYWTERGRYAFMGHVGKKIVGFALVNAHVLLKKNKGAKAVAEFFIVQECRKKGLGAQMANRIFDLFPGKWEISAYKANKTALIFWEKVINRRTGGKFTIAAAKGMDGKMIFSFSSYVGIPPFY